MTRSDLMPRDTDGRALCAGCGALARRGWVYKYGSVRYTTCRKERCMPQGPDWWHAVDIVHTRTAPAPL